jgi:hypothetical protein
VKLVAAGGANAQPEGAAVQKPTETPSVTVETAEVILTAFMSSVTKAEREGAVTRACQSILNGLDVALLKEVADACRLIEDTSMFFFGAVVAARNGQEISGIQDQINSAEITKQEGKIGKDVANALRQFAQFRLKGLV